MIIIINGSDIPEKLSSVKLQKTAILETTHIFEKDVNLSLH